MVRHQLYKLIEDCDEDGSHRSHPYECVICGTVFCVDCASDTGQGQLPLPDTTLGRGL